jgi:hypothetical protein
MRILAVTELCVLIAATALSAEEDSATGTWRGESICTTEAAACHNETVVYYINDVPNDPNLVTIRADKIVDGQAITMGSGPWKYDRVHHTLEWRSGERVWLLTIKGRRIEGILTLADKTVFRKVTLKKDES